MEQNKFLLLIDLWRQTNTTIYNEIFQDEKRRASCNIKVIPLKYSLCQPCDVYFYRQVKDFIKRLQNASIVKRTERNRYAKRCHKNNTLANIIPIKCWYI